MGTRRSRLATLGLVLAVGVVGLVGATASSASAIPSPPPAYYPSGPQVNVNQSQLVGWVPCYSDVYANNLEAALPTVLNQCTGEYLLLAGGPTNSTTFDVLAAAPRTDVLFDTGVNYSATHSANGSEWYFNAHYSWGFAKGGDTVNKNQCDEESTDGQYRLCWHTINGAGGWRSGVNTWLNGSTDYRRVIYQPGAACPAGTKAHQLTAATNIGSIFGVFCVNAAGIGTYTENGTTVAGKIIKQGAMTWFSASGNNLAVSGYVNGSASSFAQTKPTAATGKVTSFT